MQLENLQRWLCLTDQQYKIITTINWLNKNKIFATAANIGGRLKEVDGHSINKPNLFRQLKKLSDNNIIMKKGKIDYVLDIKGISMSLNDKEAEINDELVSFKEFADNFDKSIKHIGEEDAPLVKYLDSAEAFFEEVNKILFNSDKIYIVSPFANISFSGLISKASSRDKYVELLMEKGIYSKKLQINYLTQFNLYVPFYHAYNKLKDKEASLIEVEATIKNLKNVLKSKGNIKMHYLEYPYGFDFLMPVIDDDPYHLFLYTRDENNIIKGGIYIQSREIAQRAENHFLRECEVGLSLKTKQGMKKIDLLFRKLNKLNIKQIQ